MLFLMGACGALVTLRRPASVRQERLLEGLLLGGSFFVAFDLVHLLGLVGAERVPLGYLLLEATDKILLEE